MVAFLKVYDDFTKKSSLKAVIFCSKCKDVARLVPGGAVNVAEVPEFICEGCKEKMG